MKIWFAQHNWPWSPEKYRFPTEQMLLTLFPGEKPEYPDTMPPDMGGGQGVLHHLGGAGGDLGFYR